MKNFHTPPLNLLRSEKFSHISLLNLLKSEKFSLKECKNFKRTAKNCFFIDNLADLIVKNDKEKNFKIMNDLKKTCKNDVLILNYVNLISDNPFYFELFKVPEIMNRLLDYRDILSQNDLNIPLWVYNLTQNLKIITTGQKPYVLNLLISLGLFDRYILQNGWPKYFIGSGYLISLIAGETSFEEQALLLNQDSYQENLRTYHVYQAKSYYNENTESFYLTNLQKQDSGDSLAQILSYLKKESCGKDMFFQFLSPHNEKLALYLNSRGIYPKDFLESSSSLSWLWPLWKRNQIDLYKKKLASC